jgi:hypothetical protein
MIGGSTIRLQMWRRQRSSREGARQTTLDFRHFLLARLGYGFRKEPNKLSHWAIAAAFFARQLRAFSSEVGVRPG